MRCHDTLKGKVSISAQLLPVLPWWAAVGAAGAGLTPREAFAEARGLVSLIKDSAARPGNRHAQATRQHQRAGRFRRHGGRVDGCRRQGTDRCWHCCFSSANDAALADLGADPIPPATHWHFDHTDGNAWINAAGAKIIAQENTRKYLSQVQRVEDWDYNFLAFPPGGIPSEVFARERSLKLNGSTVALKHYGAAHTDSDTSVTFAEANVVHLADTFWNGIYPFIDYSTGGSIDGMIAASDGNLAATNDGHHHHRRPWQSRGHQIRTQVFRDMLVTVRDNGSRVQETGPFAR